MSAALLLLMDTRPVSAEGSAADPVSIELSLTNRRSYPMRRPRYHEAALMRFLGHEDPTVRRNALRDLVHNFGVSNPSINSAVSGLLNDRDAGVRAAAAEALGVKSDAAWEPARLARQRLSDTAPAALGSSQSGPSSSPARSREESEARARIAGMLDDIRAGCLDFAVNSELVRFESEYRAARYERAATHLERAADAQARCSVAADDEAARTRLMTYQGKIQARLAGIRASWQDEKVAELLRDMSARAAGAEYAEADALISRIERYQSTMRRFAPRLEKVDRRGVEGRVERALRDMRDAAADSDFEAAERVLAKIERFQEITKARAERLAGIRSDWSDELIEAKLAEAEQAAFDGQTDGMDRILASLELYKGAVSPRSDRIAAARSGWRDARVDRLLRDLEQGALRGEASAVDRALVRIERYARFMGPENGRLAAIRAGPLDDNLERILERVGELIAHGEESEAEARLAEAERYQALRARLVLALDTVASDPIEAGLLASLTEKAGQNDSREAERALAKLEKHRETRKQIMNRLADLKSSEPDTFSANWILVCEESLKEGNLAGANKALAMVEERA